jgi:hypothetical protein
MRLRLLLTRTLASAFSACNRIIDHAQAHIGHAVRYHFERLGGRFRQINDATAYEWSTIINSHHDRATVGDILDEDLGAERQRIVRSGESDVVHLLAARRK